MKLWQEVPVFEHLPRKQVLALVPLVKRLTLKSGEVGGRDDDEPTLSPQNCATFSSFLLHLRAFGAYLERVLFKGQLAVGAAVMWLVSQDALGCEGSAADTSGLLRI